MNNLYMRATGRFLRLLLLLQNACSCPPLDYWEGWLLSGVFAACSVAMTLYLAVNDPQLLEQRMQIGPAAETERSQKIIIVAVLLVLTAPAVSATDRRLGWSSAPAVVVVLGDLLIVLAHIGVCLVFIRRSSRTT
jgi:protein-S-isoprenylcysteine O-methyltransferase Ste14